MSPEPRLEKSLPQNIDAERSILGAVLLDNKALDVAAEKVKSGDFFYKEYEIIFHAMLALHEEQRPIDLVTLTEFLDRKRQLSLIQGGASAIAALMDGVPRGTNVAHYAGIVHEKSLLRQVIHTTHAIQQKALGEFSSAAEISVDLELFSKTLANGNGHRRRPESVPIQDFLLTNLKPAEFVIDPILPVQGLALAYCWRGGGKTYFCLELAAAVATGGPKCFVWNIPKPRRVLYVDGEMPANEMQERLRGILQGRGMKMPPEKDYFRLFTPDLVEGHTLNIVTSEGQRVIEDQLIEGDFLVLDNLSALGHAGESKESEAESWWPVQEWALRLRKRGITILFIHHAGKKGEQRGTSAREDLMHTVIAMRRPADYNQHEGLRTEIHFEKLRKYMGAEGIYPFELKMETDPRGAVTWTHRPLKDIIEQRVAQMFQAGMKPAEISDELHLSRFQVYRMKRKIDAL